MEARISIVTPGVKDLARHAGYFADPDGYPWEVACGTGPLNPDGAVPVP